MNPEEISKKIETWIKNKVKEAGARGVVLGLSGGVDSAVSAILARKAVGKKALALLLPCESKKMDEKLAKIVIKKFDIKYEKIDLTPIFKHFKKILPKADKKTLGNLKARLRMAVLYYYANKYRYLVLGTSNRSEIWMGYFTKYGDGACDILPLGGLYKTQVIELAKYLEVPKEILNASPSAGLWRGQTDEREIGMSYSQLDLILWEMESGKLRKSRLNDLVRQMIEKSRHKRKMPDICEI
ncbi:MAG: NAD+ synthase [Candidatus Aenigmatarchaeota archaeon]